MWNVYFGEWGDGRLKRLPYLGYYILLMVLVLAIIFGTIFAVGGLQNIMGGNIAETQTELMGKFGLIGVFAFAAMMIVVMVAQVNILAKRIRDMGLPALWTILGIIAVSIVIGLLFPSHQVEVSSVAVKTAEGAAAAVEASTVQSTSMVQQIFELVLFLALVFIPSDTFGKRGI